MEHPEIKHDELAQMTRAGFDAVDERFEKMDTRFEKMDARFDRRVDVLEMKTRPAAEWLEILTREDVPCAPVLTRSEMLDHPQVRANGIVVETDHPDAGRLRQTRPAARFSATPAAIRFGGRAIGADNAAILAELGYSASEIAALREKEPAA